MFDQNFKYKNEKTLFSIIKLTYICATCQPLHSTSTCYKKVSALHVNRVKLNLTSTHAYKYSYIYTHQKNT